MKEIDLNVNPATVDSDFPRIAKQLMNDWILECEESRYRICEVEFYYNSEVHQDDYSHKHDIQKTSGKWYFHGSGIDITFGDGSAHGGILLRAIYNIEKQEYIYGPLRLLTELFSNFPSVRYSSLKFGLIYDQTDAIGQVEEPISAPRVGLDFQKDKDMYNKLYRFLIMRKKEHAEKTRIIESMKLSGKYSDTEIQDVWG